MAIENKNTIVEVEDDSLYTLTLKKPVVYNEKEYSELTFDFEKLTGNDALNIEDASEKRRYKVKNNSKYNYNFIYFLFIEKTRCCNYKSKYSDQYTYILYIF